MESKNTTIKISKKTKKRLDNLKIYKRESYEEVIEEMLNILNICRADPEEAKKTLINISSVRKSKNI